MTSQISNSHIIDMSGCCGDSKQGKSGCRPTVLEFGKIWQCFDIAFGGGVTPCVGLFGTAVTIYAYVQGGNYLFPIAGTILSGTLLFEGCRQFPNLLHKISIERALNDLGKDNAKLDELNSEAKKNNLELINKINNIEQLELSLRKQNSELKESLKKETDHLADTGSKLEATTKRLEVIGKLYQQFKDSLESLSRQTKDVKDNNNVLKKNVSDLTNEELKLNSFEKIFSGDIKSVEEINHIFDKQILDDSKLLEQFTEQKKNSEERCRLAEEQIILLKKQTENLDISDDKFKDGTKENNEAAKEISNSIDHITDILKQLKKE